MLEPSRSRPIVWPVVLALLVTFVAAPATAAKEPPGLDRFMWAIGWWESGGRYNLTNDGSSAFGKYQFMPESWLEWSAAYLGTANARRTPTNQEAVARAKFVALYEWLGNWHDVAFWWLTGTVPDPKARVAASTRRYVDGVMALYARGPSLTNGHVAGAGARRSVTVQESDPGIAYAGTWSAARHAGYLGGGVRYSGVSGASATVTFSGRSIAWIGPTGPTRGRVRILLDGVVSKVVDLRSAGFRIRRVLFAHSWRKQGIHTLTIEVLPAPGRQIVAVDAFVLGP